MHGLFQSSQSETKMFFKQGEKKEGKRKKFLFFTGVAVIPEQPPGGAIPTEALEVSVASGGDL